METVSSFCNGKNISLFPYPSQKFDLSFPKGKLTFLIGKNGSGKTTLLKAILGVPHSAMGNLYILDSQTPSHRLKPREISNLMAYVGQDPIYPQNLLVEDFLRLAYLPKTGFYFQNLPKTTYEMEDLALKIGVDKHFRKPLGSLSTGERQRIFLTRALLQKPKLLILDEPTNHLDPGAKKNFWNLLLKLKKEENFEVLISTHDIEFVKSQLGWVVGLRDGGISFSLESSSLTEKLIDDLYFEDPDAE